MGKLGFVVAFGIVLSGCLESSLVVCGDQLCPVDATCQNGVCVSPESTIACAGLEDGDACTVFDVAGVCRDGVCALISCGNGTVESGEVCDDGNRANGDGCRGDCLSDETCGNGLVDPGESCDCGRDDATRPTSCTRINDDAVDALCNTQCNRRCGDGLVTGGEQCDMDNIPVSCRDLGYYQGQTSCSSFCGLVLSACNGRCGDGVLDAAEGELCDQTPPVENCVDYGRDYGVLSCNALCAPDVAHDCHSYGWVRVLLGDPFKGILNAQANGHGAILWEGDGSAPNDLRVVFDGVGATRELDDVQHMWSTDDAFFVWSPTEFLRYDATGWHTLPHPDSVFDGAVGTDGLYVISIDSTPHCTIRRLDFVTGAATDIPGNPLQYCFGIDIVDGRIALGGLDRVAWYDGQSWQTQTGISGATKPYWRDATHIVFDDHGSGRIVQLGSASTIPLGPYDFITTSSNGDEIDTYTDPDDSSIHTILAITGVLRTSVATPTDNLHDLYGVARAADGSVVGWGRAVYRLDPAWTRLATGNVSTVGVGDDGSVTYCAGGSIVSATIGNIVSHPWSGTCSGALTVGTAHYATRNTGGLYRADGNADYVLEDGSVNGKLHIGAGGDLWAVGTGATYKRSGGTWTQLPVPDTCYSILSGASDATNDYVTAYCPGGHQLYRWNGASFDAVGMHTDLFIDLVAVSPQGGVFGGGYQGFKHYDPATMTWTKLADLGDVLSIAARADNDVYFATADASGLGPDAIYHWDGSRVTRLGATGAVQLALTPTALVARTLDGIDVLVKWAPTTPAGL